MGNNGHTMCGNVPPCHGDEINVPMDRHNTIPEPKKQQFILDEKILLKPIFHKVNQKTFEDYKTNHKNEIVLV